MSLDYANEMTIEDFKKELERIRDKVNKVSGKKIIGEPYNSAGGTGKASKEMSSWSRGRWNFGHKRHKIIDSSSS